MVTQKFNLRSARRILGASVAGLCITLGMSIDGARAATITFDDTSAGQFGAVPNGYDGFNWTNFNILDGDPSSYVQPNGYKNGRVSGSYVAFNDNPGTPASFSSTTAFDLARIIHEGRMLRLAGPVQVGNLCRRHHILLRNYDFTAGDRRDSQRLRAAFKP